MENMMENMKETGLNPCFGGLGWDSGKQIVVKFDNMWVLILVLVDQVGIEKVEIDDDSAKKVLILVLVDQVGIVEKKQAEAKSYFVS